MPDDRRGARAEARESGSELFDLLRRYAIQETLGPLKAAGRTLAFGSVAAVLLGFGSILALIGALRLLQSETGSVFEGQWSWAPYALTAVVGLFVVAGCAAGALRSPKPRAKPAKDVTS